MLRSVLFQNARSLYQRALGYDYDAEKIFANVHRATVTEHVPPDTTVLAEKSPTRTMARGAEIRSQRPAALAGRDPRRLAAARDCDGALACA
jgi:hypothetical protein